MDCYPRSPSVHSPPLSSSKGADGQHRFLRSYAVERGVANPVWLPRFSAQDYRPRSLSAAIGTGYVLEFVKERY